jgi:hypothetical protein
VPKALARPSAYFTFALAFRRSAQYFFMRALTALRAAADICRPRCSTRLIDRATLRRVAGSFNSGNVRSMAMISARSCFRAVSAPAFASSFKRSVVSPLARLGTPDPPTQDANTLLAMNLQSVLTPSWRSRSVSRRISRSTRRRLWEVAKPTSWLLNPV